MIRTPRATVMALGLLSLAGCASSANRPSEQPAPAPATPPTAPTPPTPPSAPAPPGRTGLVEAFPNVRVDRDARLIEIDGTVPIEAHDPDAPKVFLEVVVCTPDSKEHESLVVTKAKAQQVHAALLLLGLEPGATGTWSTRQGAAGPELVPVDPTGPGVIVEFAYRDAAGQDIVLDARKWILDAKTGRTLGDDPADTGRGWVFAGSRFVAFEGQQVYDADGVGTLIGLCTFGSETVAWSRTISPDSQVQEPEWVADSRVVPVYGTAVTVRLRPAKP